MRALVEKAAGYEIALIASNKAEAAGLEWAQARGLQTWAKDSKGLAKEAFDRELSQALDERDVGTVALAGFMRILSPWFVNQWSGRILNIHPSLLPKYRGLDTHRRAIDAGEVLGQSEISIEQGETAQSLEQRVLAAEHELYPRILSEFVER